MRRVFIAMKKRSIQIVVVSVAAVAGLAALGLAATFSPADAASAGHWQKVERRLASEPVILRGNLQAGSQITIAAPFDGRMAERFVELGDAVVQGQRLARIESTELEQQEREAEIALIRSEQDLGNAIRVEETSEYAMASRRFIAARNSVQLAMRRAKETQALFEKGIVARQEVDAAKQEFDSAGAQMLGAQDELIALRNKQGGQGLRMLQLEASNRRARVEELRAKRNAAVVVSPIAGVVVPAPQVDAAEQGAATPAREARAGTYVTSRDALFTVADTQTFMVKSAVDEADVSRIESCRKAMVSLNSDPARVIEGTVKRVANQPRSAAGMRSNGPETPQFEVEVLVPRPSDAASRFRLGAPATVKIEPCKSSPAVVVPIAALHWDEGGVPSVRIRKAGSRTAKLQPVSLQRTGVTDAEVSSGISAGDEVWVAQAAATTGRPAGLLRRLMQSGDDE